MRGQRRRWRRKRRQRRRRRRRWRGRLGRWWIRRLENNRLCFDRRHGNDFHSKILRKQHSRILDQFQTGSCFACKFGRCCLGGCCDFDARRFNVQYDIFRRNRRVHCTRQPIFERCFFVGSKLFHSSIHKEFCHHYWCVGCPWWGGRWTWWVWRLDRCVGSRRWRRWIWRRRRRRRTLFALRKRLQCRKRPRSIGCNKQSEYSKRKEYQKGWEYEAHESREDTFIPLGLLLVIFS